MESGQRGKLSQHQAPAGTGAIAEAIAGDIAGAVAAGMGVLMRFLTWITGGAHAPGIPEKTDNRRPTAACARLLARDRSRSQGGRGPGRQPGSARACAAAPRRCHGPDDVTA